MTIHELAEKLNQLAIKNDHDIAALPALRKRYLSKQLLPHKIFSKHTIKDSPDIYAFHHGGRDEMQFNVGQEYVNGKEYTRYGLCFSLEPSMSLTDPIGTLKGFKREFDKLVQRQLALFAGFELWYYENSKRYGPFSPQTIPEQWFKQGNFICLGRLIQKSYAHLNGTDFETILNGFDELSPIYKVCVLNCAPQRSIFTRLTSNDHYWELPSGHPWKETDQGSGSIPFENQYGFGGEEWLFNKRYSIGNYQYGFIRGIMNTRSNDESYAAVHCYTVKKERNVRKVYYCGYISNCLVIKNDPDEQAKIDRIIERFRNEQISEVAGVNGDARWFQHNEFKTAIKFRPKDVHFLEEPVYQPNFPLGTYKRFSAYPLEGPLADIFEASPEREPTTFKAGKASQSNSYNRSGKRFSITIERVHTEIVENLEKHLAPAYTLAKENIAIEIMYFHGHPADVVTKHSGNEITIYEVKTSLSARRNIREALAQLLDYACHSDEVKVRKLVIVSPVKLLPADKDYLDQLDNLIDQQLEYWFYDKEQAIKFAVQFS
ncbi:MAG TPA: hypothetical protein VIM55_19155 [Mucilaginibacter sp.]